MLASTIRHTRSMICGLVLVAGGCYSYSGAAVESVRVGEPVRARISGAQAERLEPVLGFTDRTIEGQLLDKGDSGIVIAVARPVSVEGSATVARAFQRIEVPRADLQEIETRHLDKVRTTAMVLGAAAGVGAAFAAVSQVVQLGQGGSRGNVNKTRLPPPIPLLRIRLTR